PAPREPVDLDLRVARRKRIEDQVERSPEQLRGLLPRRENRGGRDGRDVPAHDHGWENGRARAEFVERAKDRAVPAKIQRDLLERLAHGGRLERRVLGVVPAAGGGDLPAPRIVVPRRAPAEE